MIPNQMYIFLPSHEVDSGETKFYDYVPDFLYSLQFMVEIKVKFCLINHLVNM